MIGTKPSSKSDPFSIRRRMPRIVIPEKTRLNKNNSFLVSGNLDYFTRYGLALINSHLKNSEEEVNLIINCVNFSLETAHSLLAVYFKHRDLSSIHLIKTDLKKLFPLTPDQNLSYLKTIRFYVGLCLRKQTDFNLIIGDIDCLITSKTFASSYNLLCASGTTLGIGSTYDYLSSGLYEAGRNNYLWRTVKAGFTYFKKGRHGTEALQHISRSLFNYSDPIPPIDDLKLYRAYYGDQLALFFTSLEFNSAPINIGHVVKCIGHQQEDIVSFGSNIGKGPLWIPPASKRDEKLFELNKI